MKECESLCLFMHFSACFGKKKCQDKAGLDDNDCTYCLTAEGGYSWKSVGLFIERGEGWDIVQGMLHREEESYRDETVLLQKSGVSTRYFPFPALLEATVQVWFRVNSGCAQEQRTSRIQRKMLQALWWQWTVAVVGTSRNWNSNRRWKIQQSYKAHRPDFAGVLLSFQEPFQEVAVMHWFYKVKRILLAHSSVSRGQILGYRKKI